MIKKIPLVEDDYPLVKPREKRNVKPGNRVELIFMDSSNPKAPGPGSIGTVKKIYTRAEHHEIIVVEWDSGLVFSILTHLDKFRVIRREK